MCKHNDVIGLVTSLISGKNLENSVSKNSVGIIFQKISVEPPHNVQLTRICFSVEEQVQN